MAVGVDRQPAVWARGTARRQDALRLPRERHHLLRRRPEAGGGQARLLLLTRLLSGGGLAGDDHEEALALVVAEAELADGPVGLARLGRGRLDRLRRRPQALRLEELAHPRDQALDVELLAEQDHGRGGCAGAQEDLSLPRGTDRADADTVDRVEVYASSHCCESTVLRPLGRLSSKPP